MNRRFRWLAIPLVMLSLTVAACSGDDDDAPAASGTPAVEAPAVSTSAPAATAETPTGTGTGTGTGEPVDLAALAARFEGATFSALFEVDATSEDEVLAGTWNWTQDPATDRVRFDIEAEGETVVMIMSPEGVTFCSEGACFSMDAAGGMFPDLGGMLTSEIDSIQDEASTATVTAAPSQTIAGVTAECFAFSDSADGASGTICYSPEGVPLMIDARSAEGDFRLTASSYSTSVTDADFEAPYPVTSFPGMGN